MNLTAESDTALADAILAGHIFLQNPKAFGGICLHGYGPARDAFLASLQTALAGVGPVFKLPINIDGERLLGGLDLTATLARGRKVERPGLIEQAQGGVLIVPMAERIADDVAAHLAQAMDVGDLAVLLLDDSLDGDEGPPSVLMERIAFHCDLSLVSSVNAEFLAPAGHRGKGKPLVKSQRSALAATAAALGITSVRPLLFAQNCARYGAALSGQTNADDDDIAAAVRLVFAPRATQLPAMEEPPPEQPAIDEPPPEDDSTGSDEGDQQDSQQDLSLEDILLEAAAAAIPPHLLDALADPTRSSGKGAAGRSGRKRKSKKRGRPLGARPGMPGHGQKLALIDSLRAAAPWQTIRRQAAGETDRRSIHIRKSDLRVRHFEQRRESLTIFAVDASGSSALSRLAEAKGAVELMLAEAYVKRSQVALIAFRQTAAEILLPPTRSLTRARRALSGLPGGGGTPLAAGLIAAQHMAEAAIKRGQTPTIALLTDGKGNVKLDGTPGRTEAREETEQVARIIAGQGINSIVLDISPRPREEAAQLAAALRGRYLPLPYAQSAAMVQAIESVNEEQSR